MGCSQLLFWFMLMVFPSVALSAVVREESFFFLEFGRLLVLFIVFLLCSMDLLIFLFLKGDFSELTM